MHDLIIIGAGPAGLAAALYAGRFRLKTLIFEKLSAGGQIILSSEIENYPGFPGGISTYELIERFKKQVQELGLTIENEEVLEIVNKGQSPQKAGHQSIRQDWVPIEGKESAPYTIKTTSKTYEAKTVIIAAGARPKQLGVKGEEKFVGRGVSYCGTCDGPLFRDKEIALAGGGDRAIEEVIFLSGYARKIYLVHRRSEFRASKILLEKAKRLSNVNFVLDSTIEEIVGKDKVEAIVVKNISSQALSTLACEGVFIFVGIEPNTEFVKNVLEIDEKGFIIADQEMRTSLKGIFACGDCRKKSLYQVITACAEGAVAADAAHRYLLRA